MTSSERIGVVVTGAAGRMGSTLVRLVHQSKSLRVAGGTEQPGAPALGQDVGSFAAVGLLGIRATARLAEAIDSGSGQVVIDFTSPESSLENARVCASKSVAMVIGTTGLSVEQKAELRQLSERIPMVVSPNMSVGVNLVFKVAAELARVLGPSFDVEIVETHHRMKKDAPSGTALKLAEEVARALGRDETAFKMARQGQVGARTDSEIGLQALRGGDVVGDHTVYFFGEGERIELTHRATSRDQFARGALRAAEWVVGRPPGLYDVQDVLGLSRR